MYVEIREPGTNKLLCRYDPARRLLEFRRRGRKSTVDLSQIEQETQGSGARVVLVVEWPNLPIRADANQGG